jgi:hypothetical protein
MKRIWFTFDAFGQWSEHDKSKMKWRMKVEVEQRPSMADRPKIGSPTGHHLPLFFLSPPLSTSLAQPPHLWDKVEGQWPHGLADRPPLGSPIKGLPRGAFSFIPQANMQHQIF